ncbi:MAG: methyltransferase domain-containing protein [Candidatus Lokiarchaeota archaeon]|nr:methyltransferase domain-containing protein [Candidatus Lokiarchaeota archaeon]
MKKYKDRHLYEDADHWRNLKLSQYQHERINIIRETVPDEVTSIADIGCGNGIITNTLVDNRFVIGLDRSWAAIQFVHSNKCQAEINNIPLKNNSIDLVLCSEVLEHLTEPVLLKSIVELNRVAGKYLLITVPNDEYLSKNHIKCPKCGFEYNASYHLQSFNKNKLLSLFPEYSEIKSFECGKPVRQYVPFLLNIKQRVGKSWAQFSNEKTSICPKCSNRFLYIENKNIISHICNGMNSLLSPRKPYWLGLLLKKN